MSEQEEKKNRLLGLLTSVGIHLGMLILFLFVMGWTAPDPPLSELGSGVELNFGTDQEGSGDVQPEVSSPPGEKPTESKAEPQDVKETIPAKEVKDEPQPPAEEKLTSTDESAVVVPETKKEVKKPEPIAKPVETKPKEKDKPSPTATNKEVSKTVVNEPVTPGTTAKTDGKSTKTPVGLSQGNDKNKVGDKGSPEGTLDPNGQYTGKPGSGGNGGGGNGFALNMSGWTWDAQPQAPKLPDNENGKIVFEITVDSDGEIIQIETLQRGLSPEAERICKQEIQKRSLIHTSAGAAPERSKGRITFVLHTQ